MARQLMDGKTVKKVRPRRTVDYGGPMGRWALVSTLAAHSNPSMIYVCDSCGSCGQMLHMYRI